ncbi:hypothetical protein GYMLUDRAFT_239384 [Collybiopsis luxurians FD-317 M1]|nr:hypothetical protein GYMLUDRAFT_239384 [Collybiopsis luxurians FD-317 M1]
MDRLVISLNYPQKDLAQLIAVVGFILQREFALKREQTVRAYDCDGRGTWIQPKAGLKYWVIAVPQADHDFASVEVFGDEFDVDSNNGQNWALYGLLLEPGNLLIMPPCTPHLVLTLEASICHEDIFIPFSPVIMYNWMLAKVLVYHKVMVEKHGINAEDETVTAVALKEAIEEDFANDSHFMSLWPADRGKKGGKKVESIEEWVLGWSDGLPQTYAWPDAPDRGHYVVRQVKFL